MSEDGSVTRPAAPAPTPVMKTTFKGISQQHQTRHATQNQKDKKEAKPTKESAGNLRQNKKPKRNESTLTGCIRRMRSLAAAPEFSPDGWSKQMSTCFPVAEWTNFTSGTLAFLMTVTSCTWARREHGILEGGS